MSNGLAGERSAGVKRPDPAEIGEKSSREPENFEGVVSKFSESGGG